MPDFTVCVAFKVVADSEDDAARLVESMCRDAASSNPDTTCLGAQDAPSSLSGTGATEAGFAIPGLNLTEPLRPIGDDCGGDPCVRLLGRLDLLGASFHVEADQVHDVPSDDADDPHAVFQRPVLPEEECHYPELFALAGGGEPFETVAIPGLPGRQYILYIYPFCT